MQKAIVQLHLVVWVEELVVLVDGALVVIVGVLVVGFIIGLLTILLSPSQIQNRYHYGPWCYSQNLSDDCSVLVLL